MARLYNNAFAQNGQRNPIVEQAANTVNYDTGFTPEYSQAFPNSSESKAPTRSDINELYYQITDSIRYYQRTGVPDFQADVTYNHGYMVRHNDTVYFCIIDSTTLEPPGTGWVEMTGGGLTSTGNGHDELPIIGTHSQLNNTNNKYIACVIWQDYVITGRNRWGFKYWSDGFIQQNLTRNYIEPNVGSGFEPVTISFQVPYTDENSITNSGAIMQGRLQQRFLTSLAYSYITNITKTSFTINYGFVTTSGGVAHPPLVTNGPIVGVRFEGY